MQAKSQVRVLSLLENQEVPPAERQTLDRYLCQNSNFWSLSHGNI